MAAIEKALVVGGGIGGLTAGVALQRSGIAVDLIEIKPDLSVYGVGIIQPNNTLRALGKIGLADRCIELGASFPGWRIHDAAGNVLMDAPTGNSAAPEYPAINGITRPLLHEVLSDAARAAGVTIRLNRSVHDLVDRRDHMAVTFSDGTRGDYDLVIGCDGLYSDTRRRLFGDDIAPRFSGEAVWRYNLPRPAHVEWGQLYFGPDSKVGLVPLSPTLMYMFLVTAQPGNPWMPPENLAPMMRARLSAYGGFVAELRELITDSARVVYKPMENLLLPEPWMRNRAIIIGDAAHATTPHLAQGAAMAIEDAVLLGDLLSRDGALDDLLAEFMARRYARAKFVIDCSTQIAAWEMEAWDGIRNSQARPGELLHSATLALMAEY